MEGVLLGVIWLVINLAIDIVFVSTGFFLFKKFQYNFFKLSFI